MNKLDTKLQVLRERWKVEPHNRKIIEYQARLLEMAKANKNDQTEELTLIDMVRENITG